MKFLLWTRKHKNFNLTIRYKKAAHEPLFHIFKTNDLVVYF
ncbi:hypothetical protein D046_2058 [Vibrio parahaemolyticus V-223/04]|nr:hypothetical protein D046_2058 [Vibrio parahaemolyticus V-223/04]